MSTDQIALGDRVAVFTPAGRKFGRVYSMRRVIQRTWSYDSVGPVDVSSPMCFFVRLDNGFTWLGPDREIMKSGVQELLDKWRDHGRGETKGGAETEAEVQGG